jgi:hypothetical protein
VQNNPSSQSASDVQPPPSPQVHPLSEQRVSPQSGWSPSQQYRLFGLPFVLMRQSFGQLLQSSPASQEPSLSQAGASHVSVASAQVAPPEHGSPPDWHDPPTQVSAPVQNNPSSHSASVVHAGCGSRNVATAFQ